MALPGETIHLGASPTCEQCGVTPAFKVYTSGGGHYIGTYCKCGPYSRESVYYADKDEAERRLKDGTWERR